MVFCANTDEIIDHFGGLEDIKNKIIRHVSDKFSEDPLRVMRVAKFISRYGFKVDADTMQLCKGLVGELQHNISKERIWAEFYSIVNGRHLNGALDFLNDIGFLSITDRQLSAIRGMWLQSSIYNRPQVFFSTIMLTSDEYEDYRTLTEVLGMNSQV